MMINPTQPWPASIPPYDKRDPAFCNDPYPTLSYLRAVQPVCYVDHLDSWLVTRAVDVQNAFKNDSLGHREDSVASDPVPPDQVKSNLPRPLAELHRRSYESMRLWLVMRNPPEHTRLHAIIAPHFSGRRLDTAVDASRKRTAAILAGLSTEKPFDLFSQVLIPSAQAATDAFLGFPTKDGIRLSRLSHFADTMVDLDPNPLDHEKGAMALVSLSDYCREQVRQRPANRTSGLVDALCHAVTSRQMSEMEAAANLQLITIASYVNISRHIANAVHSLLRHRDQWLALVNCPEQVPVALEEAARFDSSALSTLHRARSSTRIGDQVIKKGELVLLSVAAANRDPELHEKPDQLNMERRSVRHFTFGEGLHYCLGAAIGRRVAQAVLTELVMTLPGLTLAAPVEFVPSYIKRIPTALMVAAG